MILFRCSTFYQLINAINIKINILGETIAADLILNCSTDFSLLVQRLKESKLFDQIIEMDDSTNDNRAIRELSDKEKELAVLTPEKYIDSTFFLEKNYTDYYIPVDDEYAKLIYYLLVKLGNDINVHIFDESKSTYVLNIKSRAEKDGMFSNQYGNKNFFNCIKELLLYEPELYMGANLKCVITKIPKLNKKDPRIQRIYNFIFGIDELPLEKYIFFESPFYWDKLTMDDMEIIEKLADLVGIENIAIKLHPRNRIDRFTKRGFKVLPNKSIPWELFLLNYSLKDKILVTISSNALITGDMLYGVPVFGIQMFRLLNVGRDADILKLYKKLDVKMLEKYNDPNIHLFTPTNWEELIEQIKYINGRIEYEK